MNHSLFVFLITLSLQTHAAPLFEDNFENTSKIYTGFSKNKNSVELAPQQGVSNTTGLKITYISNEEGSARVVKSFDLNEAVSEASLSYDVKFSNDFQFVKGGKLHGVGPKEPITGGESMKDSGWSSRVMFRENGTVETYLYNQNKTGTYGATKAAKNFNFDKDKFYAVTLYTKLNSSPEKADGEARIYVDGKLLVTHEHVLFWKKDADAAKISKFLFSTFHGGHDPSWAPKDAQGQYINVHAVFDNFVVEKGLKVRLLPGT